MKRNDIVARTDEDTYELVTEVMDYCESKFQEIHELLNDVDINHLGNIDEARDVARDIAKDLY